MEAWTSSDPTSPLDKDTLMEAEATGWTVATAERPGIVSLPLPHSESAIGNWQLAIDNRAMRILITAGPTREYLDPVRFLSNASSGKLGYAIAAVAARRGHRVELISGPVALKLPPGAKVTSVVTSEEMFQAAVRLFAKCDVGILAAAVCDYRPAKRSARKLKKTGGGLTLRLHLTRDIAAYLGRIKGDRKLIGFALESHDGLRNAEEKLRRKRCDAMILNRPDTIGADRATIQVLHAPNRWDRPVTGTKLRLAAKIVALAETLEAAPKRPRPSLATRL